MNVSAVEQSIETGAGNLRLSLASRALVGGLLSLALNLLWFALSQFALALELATLDMGEVFGEEFSYARGPAAWPAAATGLLLLIAAVCSVYAARRVAPLRRTWRQWSIPFVVLLLPLDIATWLAMVEIHFLLASL